MEMKRLSSCLIATMFLVVQLIGQTRQFEFPILCKTSEANFAHQLLHPESVSERDANEKATESFTAKSSQFQTGVNCYIIPVVFHVYGTTQGGYPVNQAIIQGALDGVNNDFQGLNSDFNTVHTQFLTLRGTMPDVSFVLAQVDPNGNLTNGIVNHPVASGYGNWTGYDPLISADSWDNYKYMNVYVMNDLYGDSVTNNSGIAWYPNTSMSNAGTARVVYNGAYLGVNCNTWQPEFASTLTHEFAHWLNLIHTFNGGCTSPNDNVADTPACDFFGQPYSCHANSTINSPLNCTNDIINAENYMDYAGASGCYKMFTVGQTLRMYSALQFSSRISLWQPTNLIATGLGSLCLGNPIEESISSAFNIEIQPNPSDGEITIAVWCSEPTTLDITMTDVLGRIIYSESSTIDKGETTKNVTLGGHQSGVYFLQISSATYSETKRVIKK